MSEYYYLDILCVQWMKAYFSVDVIVKWDADWQELRYYIHPDSYDVFEIRPNDVVEIWLENDMPRYEIVNKNSDLSFYEGANIILRNGIHFIWPEVNFPETIEELSDVMA